MRAPATGRREPSSITVPEIATPGFNFRSACVSSPLRTRTPSLRAAESSFESACTGRLPGERPVRRNLPSASVCAAASSVVTMTPAAGFPAAPVTTPRTAPPRWSEIFSSAFASSWMRLPGMNSGARTMTTLAPSGASETVKVPSAPVRASASDRFSPSRAPSVDTTRTLAPPTGLPASSTTRPDMGCAPWIGMSNREFSSEESKGPGNRADGRPCATTRRATETPGLSRATRNLPSASDAVSPRTAGSFPAVSSRRTSSSER